MKVVVINRLQVSRRQDAIAFTQKPSQKWIGANEPQSNADEYRCFVVKGCKLKPATFNLLSI